jgi:hypothetical protein
MDIEPNIALAIDGSLLEMPCGCKMWEQPSGEDRPYAVFKACRPNCRMFLYAQKQALAAQIPVEHYLDNSRSN